MTARTDFTADEWTTVLEGPTSAGLIMTSASHGGTFKETLAIGKAYAEARAQHGESELLDEIVAAKPKVDHAHYRSVEELREHNLQHLRDAVGVLGRKASARELDDYRHFVLSLAERVAQAHREHGVTVSDQEQAVLSEISSSLGGSRAGGSASERLP